LEIVEGLRRALATAGVSYQDTPALRAAIDALPQYEEQVARLLRRLAALERERDAGTALQRRVPSVRRHGEGEAMMCPHGLLGDCAVCDGGSSPEMVSAAPSPDAIQAAREWTVAILPHICPTDCRGTLLRSLDALEREEDEYGEHGTHEDYMASRFAQVQATLASCDRARRAAEEECERLKEEMVNIDIAYGVQQAHLTAERDRLAVQVARVREWRRTWNDTLTAKSAEWLDRALDGAKDGTR
jgi:DNA repair exonuclease SbcCD ATPase subunit